MESLGFKSYNTILFVEWQRSPVGVSIYIIYIYIYIYIHICVCVCEMLRHSIIMI